MSNYSTDKEDEKKGTGVPPWMTGSARVGSGLSSGSSLQAGSMLARLGALLAGPKAIVALTVLGGLALGMGVVSTIQEPKQPSLAQRFNKEKIKTGSPSGDLPGMEKPGQSALNMAQSANSGFYGDPNASAQAAAPETPSDAPADAAAPDPAANAAAAGAGAGDAQSPEKMAAAMMGQQNTKAGMGGGKFGKLSQGLGGGLAGGGGLSGGIGGSFKQASLSNSRAGEARAFQGANRAQVARGKLSSNNLGKSALRGATAKRLDNMSKAMGAARAGGAEAGAATHAAQWDAAAPSGNSITGAGASGMSSGGQFSGEEGVGGGGPLDQNSTTANNPTDVKDIDNGSNQTPYQNQLMMAQGLLMLASVIITIIGALNAIKYAASTNPFTAGLGAWILAQQNILLGIAIGMSVAAAAVGASIGSQYGQQGQGQIVALGGTITAAAGAAALIWPNATTSWIMVIAGVGGMAASMMGMLKK